MKILLISPKIYPSTEIDYNYTFPVGLCYISASLKKAGYKVDCLNMNHKEGNVEDILKPILEKKYDVVMTGSIWFGFHIVRRIIDVIRLNSPHSQIIVGGNIITSDVETSMRILRPDFGVIGEGETTIIDLMLCIENKWDKNLKDVDGIAFFSVLGELAITNPRQVIENLDIIPYPDLDGFEFKKYLYEMYSTMVYYNNYFDYPRSYNILGSRGCPFDCTFCYHSLGSKYRKRSVDDMIKELSLAIDKYKINMISINDDLFSLDKERIVEFCTKIKRLINTFSWEIIWTCQLSVSSVDKNLLRIMKDSGCKIISYGFESYNQKVLDSMKKPITPQQINNAIKLTLQEGITIQGNFIFGDVAETKESCLETLNYWKDNCEGQIQLSFVQPYPGSELYNHCIKNNIIKNKLKYMVEDSWKENFFNMTNEMTDDEITILKNEILRLRNSGYFKTSIVKNIFSTDKKDRYEVEVDCPFCQKTITYKNYFLKKETFYKDFIICRNCNKRFNILKNT